MSPKQTGSMSLFKSNKGRIRYLEAYDAVLRDWPVPYEELDVPTRFGDTHVIASGEQEAPPLVLLPSLAGSATLWRPNVEGLSTHFRTYAVDVIGQVGKSVPTRRIENRQDCADWLVDVLDALDIPRTSIVGSSYGAFLALNQASLTPERVDRVILISPAGTFVGLSLRFCHHADKDAHSNALTKKTTAEHHGSDWQRAASWAQRRELGRPNVGDHD
jgi:pimeloyl-ACP methyl ester carboxylesterase